MFLEIVRSDLDEDAKDVEPASQESVERNFEQRDLLQDIETQFLPSLPRAMRADFLAVRWGRESAAEVARRTGRSRAAVSKNLAEFQKRLDNFLVQRG
jgi:DNA-directed RNA polymerase specialized sigma24 family protein